MERFVVTLFLDRDPAAAAFDRHVVIVRAIDCTIACVEASSRLRARLLGPAPDPATHYRVLEIHAVQVDEDFTRA